MESSHHDRDYFLVPVDQFLTVFVIMHTGIQKNNHLHSLLIWNVISTLEYSLSYFLHLVGIKSSQTFFHILRFYRSKGTLLSPVFSKLLDMFSCQSLESKSVYFHLHKNFQVDRHKSHVCICQTYTGVDRQTSEPLFEICEKTCPGI